MQKVEHQNRTQKSLIFSKINEVAQILPHLQLLEEEKNNENLLKQVWRFFRRQKTNFQKKLTNRSMIIIKKKEVFSMKTRQNVVFCKFSCKKKKKKKWVLLPLTHFHF